MTDPIPHLNAALEGRYRIEREIGVGGMATVYLADDLKHERKVALKVLKPELAAVVGADRFLAEIKTTANLQHPHILPLFDSGEADGFLFYVMPYVEGESLRERIDREHQLPVDEAVGIATKVAGALQAAHDQGVIHRDVKPANILLSQGQPLVSDFGIAIAVGAAGGGRMTETGLSLGTPHYMSPEQATGDQSVGPAADLYALGCVLYEMLVGEPPYTGSTPQAVLGKIITGAVPSARSERKSVPDNVDAAIRRALEKVPADRFRSAEEFVRAMSDEGFGHGARGGAKGTGGSRRHSPVTAVLGVLVVLLGLALIGLATRPSPPPPVVYSEIQLPPGVRWYTESATSLDISPDGSMMVFVASTAAGGDQTQLFLRPFGDPSASPIPGTSGAVNPRFSPDGRDIAFTVDSLVARVPTDGGRVQVLASSRFAGTTGLAWGPDGMIYVGGSTPNRGLARVSEGGGELEALTDPIPGERHLFPDVLPDGSGVIIRRSAPSDTISVLDLETGDLRPLVAGAMGRFAASGHLLFTTADGELLAAPFDTRSLEVTGPAELIEEGVRVTSPSASDFAISGTGTLVYRIGEGLAENTPVWLGRDGSEEPIPTGRVGRFRDPAISPDNERIALAYRSLDRSEDDASGIWIYDMSQGGTLTLLTRSDQNFEPFWSPDGAEVVYASDQLGPPSFFIQPWDGSAGARQLRARDNDFVLWGGTWTRDGRWLVYHEGIPPDPARLRYAAPHPDSVGRLLLDEDIGGISPSAHPEGDLVAYASDQSGRYEIYVSPLPGPGPRRQVSLDGGLHPRWSDDGREIFWRAPDLSWWVATVETEPDFSVTDRSLLLRGDDYFMRPASRQYDLSRDGQRMVALRVGSYRGDTRYVLVQNFFQELERLVPN